MKTKLVHTKESLLIRSSFNGRKKMKLHLGCGKRDFGSNWIHIDCGDFPHVASHDITQLPFDDYSCSVVYASHVIEYFDRDEVVPILKEWHRVLKPGGILRLAVPDFNVMVDLYLRSTMPIEKLLGPLYGKIQPPGCGAIYHKTAYDFQSLRTLLESVGFKSVQRYGWSETEHGHIDDHSQAYIPHMDKDNGILISLNVEGIKNRFPEV
jgi:predicted SAM-dependent methyltransferase